jgi:hypothetical protein
MVSNASTNGIDEGHKLYSAGECPVCADSGAVLLLREADSETIVFFCPLCGVAWKEPPLDRRVDEVASLETIAPNGVTLPSEAEAWGTGLRLTEVSVEDWLPLFRDLLSGQSSQ